LLEIYYRERGKKLNNETFKKTLDLLTKKGEENYASYLLADANGVSIKVAKYSGKTKVDLIENDEYGYCSLIKATKSVLHRLEIENKTFAKITSKERLEKRMVDGTALREAVVNAIVHNDYSRETPPLFEIFSDRIVITSYGGLVSGLTREEFYKGCSMVRNRELMRVFKDLDLVEQLGSGMRRIMEVYDESIFEFTDNFMFVTFPFENGYNENNTTNNVAINVVLNKREQQIYELLYNYSNETAETIASSLNITPRTAQRHLKSLQSKGAIVRVGAKKTGYWEVI
jgi:predicted HTH transcriptional regulator